MRSYCNYVMYKQLLLWIRNPISNAILECIYTNSSWLVIMMYNNMKLMTYIYGTYTSTECLPTPVKKIALISLMEKRQEINFFCVQNSFYSFCMFLFVCEVFSWHKHVIQIEIYYFAWLQKIIVIIINPISICM